MGYVVSLFLDTNEEDMDAASSFWVGIIFILVAILAFFLIQAFVFGVR